MIYDRNREQPAATPGPWYSAVTVDRALRERPGLSQARDTGVSLYPSLPCAQVLAGSPEKPVQGILHVPMSPNAQRANPQAVSPRLLPLHPLHSVPGLVVTAGAPLPGLVTPCPYGQRAALSWLASCPRS
jgi:hypothetical protein